jgi:cell division control protein 7
MLPGGLHLSLSSAAAANNVRLDAAHLHQQQLANQACLIMNTSQSFIKAAGLRESPSLTLLKNDRFATPNSTRKAACHCFGKPRVCSKCLSRRPQRAARAGTPGFRPPEVLLKFEHQTTAVDMWAAGVILLCILSRTYPFFRAPDDYTALGELVALFGSKAVEEAASQYGKRFICSEKVNPVDLQGLCQKLAERRQSGEDKSLVSSSLCLATEQAVDLLSKILALSAHERWTASEALQHPFFED